MKYGVREVCDLVYKAGGPMKIGSKTFERGQPVLYIDSAKTSTMEGASTAVYAQGGSGNARLITWTGEKTMTFTVEDALISPVGLSILAGAGLYKGTSDSTKVRMHKADFIHAGENGIEIADLDEKAPIYVFGVTKDGDMDVNDMKSGLTVSSGKISGTGITAGSAYFVDCYLSKASNAISEIQIDASEFSGNFYVEGNTLFRDTDGVDHPAVLTFPNVKIQSNFSIAFAATGDPSTFTFTMDAMPGYTYFDNTKKVFVTIQVLDDVDTGSLEDINSLFDGEKTETTVIMNDSTTGNNQYSV